jgi:hypothetical protein
MRAKPLKTRDLILSLSKDEAKTSCSFSGLLGLYWRQSRSHIICSLSSPSSWAEREAQVFPDPKVNVQGRVK